MAKEGIKFFYDTKEWKKCRKAFIETKHYICERCGGVGKLVHHKKHITPSNVNDMNITLNWDNLQVLCLDCHNVVHGNGGATVKGVSFNQNGDLIYSPPHHKEI
ncbi:HNH endonuclease [Clostridium botulinum]|uniref:Putative HNH nuclease YajD n=1 Tax=Clostridium botulinum (strain Eklund 17B / Type B) TaxID=935198 RepID=B2THE5_CLOBB|nr:MULTISPECIES: HNH endonuclease [Clostridium]ACD24498.1 prophage LambdaBa04, Gp54 [Clostridium botulinum B str. Eklund 17B (NRP)]MBY6977420.1 HNH endonuclease [Clostridium botulinum]MBY7001975.1 HNH endonuclease [Clostridium botulinum]MCR1275578.1 HNH endonuclease [Clostridium botulinum]MCS6131411.1 HNH endonuclease [Clostridium botulinum]